MACLSMQFSLTMISKCSPTTPREHAPLVWALPRSLANTWGLICYFLFLRVLRCFSSPGWLSFEWYSFRVPGCPIRKSSVISLVCSLPKLIAAYHVLHRLLVPRHPPCALIRFKYRVYIIVVLSVDDWTTPCCFLKRITEVIPLIFFVYFRTTTLITKKIAFPICQRTFSMCEY